MKKFLAFLSAIVMLSMLSSCEKEVFTIYDWVPIEVEFKVVDNAGHDLLDAQSDNYVGDMLTLEYADSAYHAVSPSDSSSKDYMPYFYGLRIWVADDGGFKAMFGELDGSRNWDEDFIVRIDGQQVGKIHFFRKHKSGNNVKDAWTLDGNSVDRRNIVIVR